MEKTALIVMNLETMANPSLEAVIHQRHIPGSVFLHLLYPSGKPEDSRSGVAKRLQ
jgi:hypothetical protein